MSLGYSYTMATRDMLSAPAMTARALDEKSARAAVEKLLARDDELFCGIVRNLDEPGGPMVLRCRRASEPGRFLWTPLTAPAAPVWA